MENRPNQAEKMEGKEKGDNFNLVANIITNWYDQTFATLTTPKPAMRQSDIELMGILLVARKQTLGALTTYANKHIIPTHALLRTLIETFIVLTWVLEAPVKGKKPTLEDVYKRLRRWDYTRLKEDNRSLDYQLEIEDDETKVRTLKNYISKVSKKYERLKKGNIKKIEARKENLI